MPDHTTLFAPPQPDHSKAAIENVLDLTPVIDLGPVSGISTTCAFDNSFFES